MPVISSPFNLSHHDVNLPSMGHSMATPDHTRCQQWSSLTALTSSNYLPCLVNTHLMCCEVVNRLELLSIHIPFLSVWFILYMESTPLHHLLSLKLLCIRRQRLSVANHIIRNAVIALAKELRVTAWKMCVIALVSCEIMLCTFSWCLLHWRISPPCSAESTFTVPHSGENDCCHQTILVLYFSITEVSYNCEKVTPYCGACAWKFANQMWTG